MKVDLHIHSSFSDSSRSPEEIAALAAARGVSLVSICDHATMAAYDSFPQICRRRGLKCVLGVELSAVWRGEGIHMLAYNFDNTNERMKALIEGQRKGLECEYIVYNMMRDYPRMSLDDYARFEYPREKGGWKYLYYAVARGAAATYEEANQTIYAKYSGRNALSGLGECCLADFCETVRRAGGVPVLAHPGYLHRRNPEGFTAALKEMKGLGVEGVECYYPSHTREISESCLAFCQRNDMRITAGCDCHGDFDKSAGFTIGALEVSLPMLDLKGIL